MKHLLLFLLLFPGGLGQVNAQRVRLETDAGSILLELYADKAPISVANFLRYVDENRYDGSRFYRVVRRDNQPQNAVKIEVIQGGFEDDTTRQLPPIPQETTQKTGLKHRDGTLSLARTTPNSGTSEFFICINDQPELDFGGKRNPGGQGFAAFGRVVEGMDVVRRIQRGTTGPAEGQGQWLQKPVIIRSARRVN
ncbi:peptidylprolyl isomerase [Larkinella bovis]|uniref:Peptidyl-prolyl cis-trans isomerase n=1 Tax=Larkinella bovis TaxID=683041 RepID=A0ABW0IIW7_9BACT